MKPSSGIALIAVMAALMILSAIALGLAASVQTEARIEAADFDAIQAAELARSGQEFAAFLELRGLKRSSDFLAGLPFQAVVPGFHYRSESRAGTVDMYFEADNGKLDLSGTPPELLMNFFSLWTGDFTKAQLITAAIEDWRDPDNDVRPNGAEAAAYADLKYSPRNSPLGIADPPLIRGLDRTDYQFRASQENGKAMLSPGLDAYTTSAGTGTGVNPNFAPELVLRSLPGLTDSQVISILAGRAERPFDDSTDLQARIGVPPESPAWKYLTFARVTPAVTSIARLSASGLTRSERRVAYRFGVLNIATDTFDNRSGLGRVQRGGISNIVESH